MLAGYFYVSLIQARVLGDEETSMEKVSPEGQTLGKPWDILLITNRWRGLSPLRVEPLLGLVVWKL